MRNGLWTKGFIIGIICLFIAASLIPSSGQNVMKNTYTSGGNNQIQIEDPEVSNIPLIEKAIYYYDLVGHDHFGLNFGGTEEWAIQITPSELTGYSNWSLIAAQWYNCLSNPKTGN